MNYRRRDEIFASILRASTISDEGAGLTKIMYISFISSPQIFQYLNELIKLGLITDNTTRKSLKSQRKDLNFWS